MPYLTARAAAALLVLAMAARPGRARAQDATAARDTTTRPADAFCWRGRPLPHCAAFALFELGVHEPLASTDVRRRDDGTSPGGSTLPTFERHVSWSLGVMRNVDARTALGGAVTLAAAGNGGFAAASARARRWTGARTSAELAAGPAIAEVPIPIRVSGVPGALGEGRRPGVFAEARLNAADLVALSARAVVVPQAGGRTHAAGFVGASLGSHTALAGNVALAALTAFVIYALLGGGT